MSDTRAFPGRFGAGFEAAVARLAEVDRRLLSVILAALVVFSAFEAWVLLLRAPFSEYRTLNAARVAAQGLAAPAATLDAELDRLTRRKAEQARELAAAASARPADDGAVLDLIETLGGLAARHGVVLGRVVPSPRTAVGDSFEESGYAVEARGDYRSLHRWLSEARRGVAPLVVAELGLRSVDGGPRIAATLRLASYRLAASAPAAGAGR